MMAQLLVDGFIFLQQLADALLAIEEEKAIWSAKERTSVEAIAEKSNLYNVEIATLFKGMSEVKNELEFYREECKLLKERLTQSDRITSLDKEFCTEKSLEIDRIRDELRAVEEHSTKTQEINCAVIPAEGSNIDEEEVLIMSSRRCVHS